MSLFLLPAGVGPQVIPPVITNGHPVELRWNPSASAGPSPTTSKTVTYTVYRGHALGGESASPLVVGIYCMPLSADDTYCHWFDYGVAHGQTYAYTVVACWAANPSQCSSAAESNLTTAK
jgi:hypothetical protein